MNVVAGAYVGSTPTLAEATPWFVKKEFKLAPLVVSPELTPLPFCDIKPKEAFQLINPSRQLQKDLSEAQDKIKALHDQNALHEQTIATLTSENAQAQATIQALKLQNLRALAEKDLEIAQLEATVYALDARVRDAEAKLRVESAQGLMYHATRLELELQMLSEKAAFEERINHLELTNSKLLGDVAFFVNQRNELQEEKEFHETVIRTLHARMSYFKVRMMELEVELALLERPEPAPEPIPAPEPTPEQAMVLHPVRPVQPVQFVLPNDVCNMITKTLWVQMYKQLQATSSKKAKRRRPVLAITYDGVLST